MTRRCPPTAAALVWFLAGLAPAHAQTIGTLDLGASWVDYEGFLGSGAASLSPTIRYEAPNLSLGASGNWVVFESGNSIFQALAAGAWRSRLTNELSAELSGSGGVSKYQDYAAYGHILAHARLHLNVSQSGAWFGLASGQSFDGRDASVPYQVDLGAWTARRGFSLATVVTRTWIDDTTAYLDAIGVMRFRDPSVEIIGTLGFRTWSTGGGEGSYGDIQIQVPISGALSGLVSGGRYPSDPVHGVIAANYVNAGIRVNLNRRRSRSAGALSVTRYLGEIENEPLYLGEARLEVELTASDMSVLRVEARGAASVEISGDFTDWQPVSLVRGDGNTWELAWRVTPGVHRVNVRLNGGEWIVPKGLRPEQDEFGGAVGILVVWR